MQNFYTFLDEGRPNMLLVLLVLEVVKELHFCWKEWTDVDKEEYSTYQCNLWKDE